MRCLVCALVLVACSAKPRPEPPAGGGDGQPPQPAPPTFEVLGPARGSFVETGSVMVSGRAAATARVTVNGTAIDVAPDGNFAVRIEVPRGLSIIETHAIDGTADLRDVRAVLVGPFATSNGRMSAPIGARLGRSALAALGKTIAASAKVIDFSAAAQALNPVYDEGNCLGARVDIARVSVVQIDVAILPKPGAIDTTVTVDDVEVKLDVRYKVACLGGSTTMAVRTTASVRGDLRANVAGRRLRTTFFDPDVTLQSFQLDLGGVPGPIQSVLRRASRPVVELTLARLIESKVPPLADARFAELLAQPPVPQLLGRDVRIEVVPRALEPSMTGIVLAAETAFAVAGGEGGRYVATPASFGAPSTSELGVWVAADAVNQLLAGLWAAHAFERTVPRDRVGALAMLLDDKVQSIQLALALPPTVSASNGLELAIGDLIITARDAAGAELQKFAVSVRCGLAIKPGEVALATAEPIVQAQVLVQSPQLARPLDGPALEGVVKGAWGLVASNIDDALGRLPIPGFATLEVKNVGARDGLIVLDAVTK